MFDCTGQVWGRSGQIGYALVDEPETVIVKEEFGLRALPRSQFFQIRLSHVRIDDLILFLSLAFPEDDSSHDLTDIIYLLETSLLPASDAHPLKPST